MGTVWSVPFPTASDLVSLLSLRTLAFIFVLTNVKSLHFMWMVYSAPDKHLSPQCLFLPAINATRSPALECDYNLHKSNSTYFTDMDMSRGNFCLVLFGKPFNPFPGQNHFTMILGGTSCTWRKEIKPYQPYELWTRVLSWDEKWLYVVTHFVRANAFSPDEYAMQPHKRGSGRSKKDIDPLKAVYASSVGRYVFKNNRRTIPPEEVLKMCKLLPEDEAGLAEVEKSRAAALVVGRLEAGWDAVHGAFQPGKAALGRYWSAY
ncbi:hypothetical protein B0T10DRAFT_575027 [Thelonectria olida]|uniref:Thioesterase n=1 Tax=Thelonectria olida TaxID=1576542 RepID=A0A9P8W3E3_9HYPO|nr:hypothetical protein B0T10DRAFT_575027 [Thelonectria olida]